MTSTREYDVVIVGGGPAGSAAGKLLAEGGLSVLILEKRRFPREKPCGGLLSGRSLRAVTDVFGGDAVARISRGTSTGCRIFRRDHLVGEVTDADTMVAVRREQMDAFFLKRATDAGCDVREEAKVTGVSRGRSEVRLSSGEAVRAAVIVGADGVAGVVRRCLRPRRRGTLHGGGFSLVCEAPGEELEPTATRDAPHYLPEIYFGLMPWGCGWVFPKEDSFSIGVAGPLKSAGAVRRSMKQLVEMTCRTGAWERLHVRGHRLPVGEFDRTPGHGNVLLTGDAAGLVDPVTGEGVCFALESSRLAASAVLEALAAGTPRQAGRNYNAAYRRRLLPHLRHAALARWLLFPRCCMPIALWVLRRNADRIRWFLDILSGRLSYPGYFRRLLASAGCSTRTDDEAD